MTDQPTQQASPVPDVARRTFGDIAPTLADYTDKILFGDVWARPGLSPRDRSLITVASLAVSYRQGDRQRRDSRRVDRADYAPCVLFRLADCQYRVVDHKAGFRGTRRLIDSGGF
jgi:alkylhydroperoxidase/carboxymuconolactone decarboxylase family protein YurZ